MKQDGFAPWSNGKRGLSIIVGWAADLAIAAVPGTFEILHDLAGSGLRGGCHSLNIAYTLNPYSPLSEVGSLCSFGLDYG